MNIIIGCDHGGFELKQEIMTFMLDNGHQIIDAGCYSTDSVDYPNIASEVCCAIGKKNVEKGILICGTGIGMSIAANRQPGIRAALCMEPFSARLSRQHNDANILCLGGRLTGVSLAIDIVATWLDTEFSGGRHQRRIDMLE